MANPYVPAPWRPANAYASWLPAAAASAISTCVTDRAQWDSRMADYLRAEALYRADMVFGDYGKHEAKDSFARADLKAEYGPAFLRLPELKDRVAELHAECMASDELNTKRYLEPLWEAQRQLVLTPAPDLAAALFKIELIEEAELDNDGSMPRDPFEIVVEDMARLAGEAHHD